ncbi:Tail tubular protein Gp11 [uncultured Caudovirales phage]|uniref:Tail tubular protein Gp11 n=1 Tax=uncultured Caudovirales phage TaxID=2100421 RepID=A0A6J5QER2_9CAUD|nr:Tail tubular protein Gp11 [uncultured Caudovirales phage]
MASSLTEIANSALVKLGQSSIMSIDDGSVVANICKGRIDAVRRLVLRMHPWNCAIDRASLAPLTETPAFGFSYKFVQPANCLRILEVGPDDPAYRVEGRNILCDSDSIELKFIADITEYEKIDELLAEAISCYLAWDIAYKITNSNESKGECWRMFTISMRNAKTIDAQEERDYSIEANLFVDSRIGGVRGRGRGQNDG